MDNQPPLDPNQPRPQGAASDQPGFQPPPPLPAQQPYRAPPFPPRPTFSPPPGYQQVAMPPTPPPQILPHPVTPGQPPYIPPTAPSQMPQPPAYQQPPAPPAKKRKYLWWLVGLLVAAILVGAALYGVQSWQAQSTKAPQKISDQFIGDLQKDNSTAAYDLTSTSYQQSHTDVSFKKIVDQASPGLQGPASVSDRQITKTSPAQATLVYKIPTQYTTQYIKVMLEKADTWQVTSFTASTLKPNLKPAK